MKWPRQWHRPRARLSQKSCLDTLWKRAMAGEPRDDLGGASFAQVVELVDVASGGMIE